MPTQKIIAKSKIFFPFTSPNTHSNRRGTGQQLPFWCRKSGTGVIFGVLWWRQKRLGFCHLNECPHASVTPCSHEASVIQLWGCCANCTASRRTHRSGEAEWLLVLTLYLLPAVCVAAAFLPQTSVLTLSPSSLEPGRHRLFLGW